MRWWGWGDPEHPPSLPAHALGFLRENVGLAARPARPWRSALCAYRREARGVGARAAA